MKVENAKVGMTVVLLSSSCGNKYGPVAVGEITKLGKASADVKVFGLGKEIRFNQRGSYNPSLTCKDVPGTHYYSTDLRDTPATAEEIPLLTTALQDHVAKIAADLQAEKDRKVKEQKDREAAYQARIATFWNDHGQRLWNSRKEIKLGGLDFLEISHEVFGRKLTALFAIRQERSGWHKGEMETIVERGGFEVRLGHSGGASLSFYSGSSYRFPEKEDFAPELMYKEFSSL